MTHEQFVTLKTAKLAKQAGFDREVNGYYSYYGNCPDNPHWSISLGEYKDWNNYTFKHIPEAYSSPTQAVLQRWLREVKNCEVKVYSVDGTNWCKDEPKRWWQCDIGTVFGWCWVGEELKQGKRNTTYKAALEAELQKCLTLIIKKQC